MNPFFKLDEDAIREDGDLIGETIGSMFHEYEGDYKVEAILALAMEKLQEIVKSEEKK